MARMLEESKTELHDANEQLKAVQVRRAKERKLMAEASKEKRE